MFLFFCCLMNAMSSIISLNIFFFFKELLCLDIFSEVFFFKWLVFLSFVFVFQISGFLPMSSGSSQYGYILSLRS